MANDLVAEILDVMFSHRDKFDTLRQRVVVGFRGYTVYAVIEDQGQSGLSLYGESSYGSFSVTEALEALLGEISKEVVA